MLDEHNPVRRRGRQAAAFARRVNAVISGERNPAVEWNIRVDADVHAAVVAAALYLVTVYRSRRIFSSQLLTSAATSGERTLLEAVSVRQANAVDWRHTAHLVQHDSSGKIRRPAQPYAEVSLSTC